MTYFNIIINYLVAFVILGLASYILYTEITRKVKTDLFVDVTLALMVIGVCLYNLYSYKFNYREVITYLYTITIIISIINICYFALRHLKNKV